MEKMLAMYSERGAAIWSSASLVPREPGLRTAPLLVSFCLKVSTFGGEAEGGEAAAEAGILPFPRHDLAVSFIFIARVMASC